LTFFLAITIAFCHAGLAQTRPVLTIKAHTEAGVAIPGATVRVERDGSLAIQTVTDNEGKGEIPSLASGQYKVIVIAKGFQEIVVSINIYDLRQTIETDLTLIPTIRRNESVDVLADATAAELATTAPATAELRSLEMETLPSRPSTVTDALPLVPGVIRSSDGEVQIGGQGEQQSALLVNSSDSTDPTTGRFGTTVPVDSVESITVLQTPFLPQYGGFTSGVVAVETRRGGEKWRFSVKEPFPDLRVRSAHVRGLRDATPRFSVGGPIVRDKIFFSESVQYKLEKKQTRTLSFPRNESKDELTNSFSQLDYIVSSTHFITASLHLTPHHINFVDPQFFNPQPVTPSLRGRDRTLTLTDHAVVLHGLLDTTVTRQTFGTRIGAQGEGPMVLTPTGNTGNYFARRKRNSSRTEWVETLSLNDGKAHALKFGSVVARTTNSGSFDFRPVQILDSQGQLLERIDFTSGTPFNTSDMEEAFFAQDHWTVLPSLALDGGLRAEYQARASTLRFGPRVAAAWTPIVHDPTVVRGGYGVFYDRVPLGVYSFDSHPAQNITVYDPSRQNDPVLRSFTNVLDTDQSDRFPLVKRGSGPGNFAPHSQTWTIGAERPVRRNVHMRVNYQHSNSAGGILLLPQTGNGYIHRLTAGAGSIYRQLEITARMSWKGGQQMLFSYVRSKAQGDLSAFSTYVSDCPIALIRPNIYSNSRGDIPNRFIAWGLINTPWKTQISPVFEFHTGQPYAVLQPNRDYLGIPYGDRMRFRSYVNLDERMSKNITVKSKYTARISMSVLNVFNHFNPLDVHANIADPLMGTFFGHYKRRYRADFELVF
jgi:hypothetical protein